MKRLGLMALAALLALPTAIAAVPLAAGGLAAGSLTAAAPKNTLHPTKVISSIRGSIAS